MIALLSVVCPECGRAHELKVTESTARKIVADMDARKRESEVSDFGDLLRDLGRWGKP